MLYSVQDNGWMDMGISSVECTFLGKQTHGPGNPACVQRVCVSSRLWSLTLPGAPTLFVIASTVRHKPRPTTMQAAGRRLQAADRPRSVVKGPRGKWEEGCKVVSKVYPEAYPQLPVPTGAKQRSHNLICSLSLSHSPMHHMHHVPCRYAVQTIQPAFGIKKTINSLAAPAEGAQVPHERESRDETLSLSSVSASPLSCHVPLCQCQCAQCAECPQQAAERWV